MDTILLPSMETSAVNERRHSPPAQSRRASVLDERTSDGTQRKKLGAELLSRLDAYVVMSPVRSEEHQGHARLCMHAVLRSHTSCCGGVPSVWLAPQPSSPNGFWTVQVRFACRNIQSTGLLRHHCFRSDRPYIQNVDYSR